MTASRPRVAVFGAAGRVGSVIVDVFRESDLVEPVAAVTARPDRHSARDGLPFVAELPERLEVDVLLDVTAPAATASIAREAVARGVALVVGATALSPQDDEALADAARTVAVVTAPNLSIGVALLRRLARICATSFDGDVEIVETHHGAKRDAPSGTASWLAEEIGAVRGATRVVNGREGQTGPREPGEIGVHALRGGDVAGEHHVHFLGDGERIELVHRASSRRAFAKGAAHAVRFAAGASPGRYSMEDVLDGITGRTGR